MDALTGLILTMIEVVKGWFSMKVAEYNCQLKKLAYSDEALPKQLIGFAREENKEDEEDYDDI